MRSHAFRFHKILLSLALIVLGSAQAAVTSPDVLVKTTTEEVLAVIGQTNDRRQLLQLAETRVLPHFDFRRMSMLAVGRSWRQATPSQQQALEKEFRDLLVRTYTTALTTAREKSAAVSVLPVRSQTGDTEVTVKTRVGIPGAQPISIDYQMERSSAGWKVFDVMVEDVSLVTNYRESFAAEIAKGGIDGLVQTLAQKNRMPTESVPKPVR